jgi:hypothetical protein
MVAPRSLLTPKRIKQHQKWQRISRLILWTGPTLNQGDIQLHPPGGPDAMDSSEVMENSDLLDHDAGNAYEVDEDVDLEGQEYEAGEYEVGDESTQDADEDVDEELEDEDEGFVFDPHPPGLKEISNLGKFTVSTHKQDNGVEELRSDDLTKFWQ